MLACHPCDWQYLPAIYWVEELHAFLGSGKIAPAARPSTICASTPVPYWHRTHLLLLFCAPSRYGALTLIGKQLCDCFSVLSWLYLLSYVKLAVTVFKYMPQVCCPQCLMCSCV